jgi:hypothetical protein
MPETDKSKRYKAICFKRSLVGRRFDYFSRLELYLFGHITSSAISREKGFGIREWVYPTGTMFVIRKKRKGTNMGCCELGEIIAAAGE